MQTVQGQGRVNQNEAVPAEPDLFESFKDTQGRFRTKSLFMESQHPSYPAHFTLKRYDVTRDGNFYISMYEKYMGIADPTEYQVAIKLLGSWDHWLVLQKAGWFREHLSGWRAELQVKLESQRFQEMKDILKGADPNSAQSVQATKWLAERYGSKAITKRGRPSKEEKAGHLKRLKQDQEDTDDDLQRIGLDKK